MPILLRGCVGHRPFGGDSSFGQLLSDVCPFPRFAGRPSVDAVRREGPAARALRSNDPVLFLEHRELLTTKDRVPEDDYEIEFGKASVVRAGNDVTVVALALMAQRTLKVAETLAGEGISVELIDPRTVAPLDVETILHIGREDGPTVDRRRGVRTVRHRRGNRRPNRRSRLRRSGRADPPAQRSSHADALQSAARGGRRARRAEQIARAIRDLVDE